MRFAQGSLKTKGGRQWLSRTVFLPNSFLPALSRLLRLNPDSSSPSVSKYGAEKEPFRANATLLPVGAHPALAAGTGEGNPSLRGLLCTGAYRVVKFISREIQTGTRLSRLRAGLNFMMSATLSAASSSAL